MRKIKTGEARKAALNAHAAAVAHVPSHFRGVGFYLKKINKLEN